ncbi:hypothetical protein NEF87_004062 [Candidatus Lokiarchaeum ossiferum]|uniref:Uncharacterized protein n=1 Tax=Candidatus Lokiarchaeum ossiferum TaxID=2951803 RepID=A0ABY6HW87_9ARCH|nr:hypothetical protein NEF87_004062 [Candidatus Lokiarchaeum sp. B-35]
MKPTDSDVLVINKYNKNYLGKILTSDLVNHTAHGWSIWITL